MIEKDNIRLFKANVSCKKNNFLLIKIIEIVVNALSINKIIREC